MNEKNILKYIALIEEKINVIKNISLNNDIGVDPVRKEILEKNNILLKYYNNKLKQLKHEVIKPQFEFGVGSIETVEGKNLGSNTI